MKVNAGQFARAGNIIIRQQGGKYKAGEGVYKAKDFTLHASIDGVVSFRKKAFMRFDGRKYERTVVEVLPSGSVSAAPAPSKKVEKKKAAPKAAAKAEKAPAKAEPKKTEEKKATAAKAGQEAPTKKAAMSA